MKVSSKIEFEADSCFETYWNSEDLDPYRDMFDKELARGMFWLGYGQGRVAAVEEMRKVIKGEFK